MTQLCGWSLTAALLKKNKINKYVTAGVGRRTPTCCHRQRGGGLERATLHPKYRCKGRISNELGSILLVRVVVCRRASIENFSWPSCFECQFAPQIAQEHAVHFCVLHIQSRYSAISAHSTEDRARLHQKQCSLFFKKRTVIWCRQTHCVCNLHSGVVRFNIDTRCRSQLQCVLNALWETCMERGFSTLHSGVNGPEGQSGNASWQPTPQQFKHIALLLPTQTGGALTLLL